MSETNKEPESVKIKLQMEYELEIKTNPDGTEHLFVSFTSSLENDLASLAVANYHAKALKEEAVKELKTIADYQEKKNATEAINRMEKAITGNTMIFNMMKNSYMKYRKTIQLAAELAKLKKQAENEQKTEESGNTTPSDVPSE